MSTVLRNPIVGANQKTAVLDIVEQFNEVECRFDLEIERCVLTMKRSAPLCFSQAMLSELNSIAEIHRQASGYPVRFRVLASQRQKVFALGGDLSFFKQCIESRDEKSLANYARKAVDLIWESLSGSGRAEMLTISLVQGDAQGGGFEAALAGHILVAERNATFGFPEGLFGMFPGMGARQLLRARATDSIACQLIGSARRYTAQELFDLGVVDLLANEGEGWRTVNNICHSPSAAKWARLRDRFGNVSKREMSEDVERWIEQAMRISPKHLRTIDYLVQAQKNFMKQKPTIRVV